MRRRLALLSAVAAGLAAAPAAMAEHWPLAGGSASRSGNAAVAPGTTPVTGAWAAADGQVRTPIVITGGADATTQRVAYGTTDGRLRLRVLATGAPVGPPEGVNLDEGNTEDDARLFGDVGAVGFADTSTEDRQGQLVVVHNDDNLATPRVYVARVRLDNGEVLSQDIVPASSSCVTESSPLLTPPAAGGGRLLYFTILCSSGLNRYLVRLPIEGDAASPAATFGKPGFALIPNATDVASPSLVVLRDPSGTPRFHVAVARRGGLSIYDASDPLEAATGNSERPPTITAALEGPDEVARTPVAPSTASGLVAGGEGSGTPAAPAIYVAADAAGVTKVYRLVQHGNEQQLKIERVAGLGENSGAPAPAMALSETVTPAGLSAGGALLVTHAGNATLLRTADLSVAYRLSAAPLGPGAGFARSVPAISGSLAYLTRDGSAEAVPEQLVLRLDGLFPLSGADFARAGDGAPGRGSQQPGVARSHAVFGSASGVYVYRARDAAGPAVSLVSPAPDAEISGTVRLVARAADPAGVDSVTFRLIADGTVRTLGRVAQPEPGGSFGDGAYTLAFPTASVSNGSYYLEAVAADSGGNTASSERRQIRVTNRGVTAGLPVGACANALSGSARPDRITGSRAGDRILGGAGDDRLDGAAGHDCVLGEAGDDVLAGGTGDDLLEGAAGEDVLAGGAGDNRIDGGSGADVARGGNGSEEIAGGAGNDTMLGGRGKDRMKGGSGRDSIKGEAGNDRLSGGAGNDTIVGGGGSNRIDGGSGNDRIAAVNGRRDVISCGKGRDRVMADRRDRVRRNCERVKRRSRR